MTESESSLLVFKCIQLNVQDIQALVYNLQMQVDATVEHYSEKVAQEEKAAQKEPVKQVTEAVPAPLRPIALLNLSVASRKCLLSCNINSIEALLMYSAEDLLELRPMTYITLNEINAKIQGMGLNLKDDIAYTVECTLRRKDEPAARKKVPAVRKKALAKTKRKKSASA